MPKERICSECGAKLSPDTQGGLCVRCLFNLGLKTEAGQEDEPVPPITEKPGDWIGRYKLLQKIGEGGCGVVYMAEQEEPVRRRVALKVIKLGMDTREVIARFEAERQALALMDHPNIAKVLDGGATNAGRPYFVMELVRGVRITEYCDQHQLPTRERLDLFIKVCQAIQHAHQKGIIHRDIKPSNILVTVNDGVPVPKVIDFGIAKATEGRLTDKTLFTAFQQFMGTPAYMSPEQAEMTSLDIDTRSDIYSLGVLLYELLTGRTPFDAKELRKFGIDAMRRTIREQEPAKPSTCLSTMAGDDLTTVAKHRQAEPPKLINLVRGDLDWIVMKCLEKDRTRRYEAANGLAADIQRHLNNEPVLASPPGKLYRLQKTMRRHKLAFAAATAVLASLVIGLGAATVMFFKERATGSELSRKNTELKLKKAEVDLKQAEVERKNAEYRAMLVEAARSDRTVAEKNLRAGEEQVAFAHLARACEYDPPSTLTAEIGIAALGDWNILPTVILAGHGGGLRSPQFSPDGTRIVTASWDKTARVWDAATGKTLMTLVGHEDDVCSAQFSPDGSRILTASLDKTARVWNASTGKTIVTLGGHEGRVSAQFSPDGTRIVTASGATARVWDTATGQGLATFVGHEGLLLSAQFNPDGTRVVTASWDKTARVWDAATGNRLVTLTGHEGVLFGAQFSPDGTLVATASEDWTARVWDAATGKVLATLVGHERGVNSVQFSPDGTCIVTASDDKSVRMWDTATGRPLATLVGHEAEVNRAQFNPDGSRIVSVSADATGGARVWDAATGKRLATLGLHEGTINGAQFSPDGKHLVTASDDMTARVWDAAMGKTLAKLQGHTGDVHCAGFSPDGKRVITASHDKTARVWDAATGKSVATLAGHEGDVWNAEFSPDGKRVVTASGDNTARLWDADTGKRLATLDGHQYEVFDARFSPDSKRIVTASWDGTACVWDTDTGNRLATLTGHKEMLCSAQFSPDGSRILTASLDKTVRVWNPSTGKTIVTLTGHENVVHSAQFSPSGLLIVTASSDGTARVWDVATGKTLATLKHAGSVTCAHFTPDGTRIVTAAGNLAFVWDVSTGKTLGTLTGHENWVDSAQFSPSGLLIVTASSDGTARVWDVATGKTLETLVGHGRATKGSSQFSLEGSFLVTTSLVYIGETYAERVALVHSAEFSPDGTRIVTASRDKTARVWNVLPKISGSPPEWFPDFLRYMAQMRLNPDGKLETLKAADWLALREQLRGVLRASAGADTPYLRVLRKYVRE